VSCTGAQFCGFGLVETKNKAVEMMRLLEEQLDIPRPVRLHWTGCPNSCGQAQVGAGEVSVCVWGGGGGAGGGRGSRRGTGEGGLRQRP
jgi:sulfite reductase beta subunit-like hemoprotein